MAQEPNHSPPPTAYHPSEYLERAAGPAFVLTFAISLGAQAVVVFGYPHAELAIGLALLLSEVALIVLAAAAGWPASGGRGYLGLILGCVWLGWSFTSGVLLALYVWDTSSRTPLSGILELVLSLAPFVVTFAVALLGDKARRWIVSRHAGRT